MQASDGGVGHGTLGRLLTGLNNDDTKASGMVFGGFAVAVGGETKYNSFSCNESAGLLLHFSDESSDRSLSGFEHGR